MTVKMAEVSGENNDEINCGITIDNCRDNKVSILLDKIGKDWKLFMRLIGIQEENIENICASNPNENIVQQSYSVLEKHLQEFEVIRWSWIEKSLKILERNDLIEEIKIEGGYSLDESREDETTENSKAYLFAVSAINIQLHWESVGLYMKLSSDEIKVIKEENKGFSEKEKAYQCLRKLNAKRPDGINLTQIRTAIKEAENIPNDDEIVEKLDNDMKIFFIMAQENEMGEDKQSHDIIDRWGFYVACHSSKKERENFQNLMNEFYQNYDQAMNNCVEIVIDNGITEEKSLSEFNDEVSVNYVERYYGNSEFFTFNYENESDNGLLENFQLFLENDEESGFMIKDYNLKKHFEFMKLNQYVKDNNFLTYESSHIMDHIGVEGKNKTIFFIKISKATTLKEIKKDIKESASFLRMFILLHKKNLVDKICRLISLVVIPTESKQLIEQINNVCSSCSNFVITEEAFHQFDINIIGTLMQKIDDFISPETWQKLQTFKFSDFKYAIANIFGFMATQNSSNHLPTLTKNIGKQIENLKILFNPKPFEFSKSVDKKVLLVGNYGSGKTFVAKSLLKKLVLNSDSMVLAYYINFSQSNDLTMDMQAYVKSIHGHTSIICKNLGDITDEKNLANVIKSLEIKPNEQKPIHLIFDEVQLSDFTKKDVLEFIEILHTPQFTNIHCMIICQAMKTVRSFTQDGENFNQSFTEQIELLSKKADFKIKELDGNFRNTLRIAALAQDTKELLEKKANLFYTKILNKVYINSKSQDSNGNLTNETGSSKYFLKDKATNEISETGHIIENRSTLSTDIEVKVSFSNLDLMLKSLGQKISKNDNSNSYLESRFTYFHDNIKTIHRIEGPLPLLYFPFDEKDCYSNIEKIYNVCLCFKDVVDAKILTPRDPITVIHFEMDTPRILEKAFLVLEEHYSITFEDIDIKGFLEVQGCEYDNVIIYISAEEYYLRHYLVEAITRSKNNLIFIVVKEENNVSNNSLFSDLIQKWIDNNLVIAKYQNDLKHNDNIFNAIETSKMVESPSNFLQEQLPNIEQINRFLNSLESVKRPVSTNVDISFDYEDGVNDDSNKKTDAIKKTEEKKEKKEQIWAVVEYKDRKNDAIINTEEKKEKREERRAVVEYKGSTNKLFGEVKSENKDDEQRELQRSTELLEKFKESLCVTEEKKEKKEQSLAVVEYKDRTNDALMKTEPKKEKREERWAVVEYKGSTNKLFGEVNLKNKNDEQRELQRSTELLEKFKEFQMSMESREKEKAAIEDILKGLQGEKSTLKESLIKAREASCRAQQDFDEAKTHLDDAENELKEARETLKEARKHAGKIGCATAAGAAISILVLGIGAPFTGTALFGPAYIVAKNILHSEANLKVSLERYENMENQMSECQSKLSSANEKLKKLKEKFHLLEEKESKKKHEFDKIDKLLKIIKDQWKEP